jgi:hypothetical protein
LVLADELGELAFEPGGHVVEETVGGELEEEPELLEGFALGEQGGEGFTVD